MTTNKPRNWNEVIQDLNKKDNPANKPLPEPDIQPKSSRLLKGKVVSKGKGKFETDTLTLPAELPVLTDMQYKDWILTTPESNLTGNNNLDNRTAQRDADQSLYSQALKVIKAWEEKHQKSTDKAADEIDSLERRVAELEEENNGFKESINEITLQNLDMVVQARREVAEEIFKDIETGYSNDFPEYGITMTWGNFKSLKSRYLQEPQKGDINATN